MSGKTDNLIFHFLQKGFQSCPKGSLQAGIVLLRKVHWALQTVPCLDLGLKFPFQCLWLVCQSCWAEDPGKGGKRGGVGGRDGNAAEGGCSGNLVAWVVHPKLG